MSSDPKGPEPTPLTAEADEHEGHYAWEVEPFDPEGPVGIVISMADVECGQPLDATLVVLADSDDEREVEWARSTADDIAARLNEHQAQAATIAELQREIEGYRQALAQRGHVAEFREDGWSLEHPVECRAIGLIDCAVNLACGYEQTAPQLGRFVVTVNEDGFLVLGERVLAGKEAQG